MSDGLRAHHIEATYVHLADGGAARTLEVTPSFWPDLMSGKLGQLEDGRLLSCAEFSEDWDSWEKHPEGEELVLLMSGSATLVLEQPAGSKKLELAAPGAFVLIPRNTWHTAKTQAPCTLLFITPGKGTQHRPL